MTPDAAFGHERGGTAATLAELGRREGFEVVVVPPFSLDGHEVRSSDIRAAIAAGDLATAERLLGRPYAVVGDVDRPRRGPVRAAGRPAARRHLRDVAGTARRRPTSSARSGAAPGDARLVFAVGVAATDRPRSFAGRRAP